MDMEWSNRIGHRGRKPWLLLIDRQGTIHHFEGASVPGVVAVVGSDYTKEGKWSHTTYRLELAPGVRAIAGRNGWETDRFTEGLASITHQPCDTWIQVADALGVMLPEAQRFLRVWRPLAAEALDKVEEDLAQIAAANDEYATLAVNFGGPTNRAISEGFWGWPVVVTLHGREVGRVVPDEGDWSNPVASGNVRVLAAVHGRGYHGGYVSLSLAAPEGAEARHGGD